MLLDIIKTVFLVYSIIGIIILILIILANSINKEQD